MNRTWVHEFQLMESIIWSGTNSQWCHTRFVQLELREQTVGMTVLSWLLDHTRLNTLNGSWIVVTASLLPYVKLSWFVNENLKRITQSHFYGSRARSLSALVTQSLTNQDNELCSLVQFGPEPPPGSEFLSFFSLYSRPSESFGKVGQIDQIWGWIWVFLYLKGWKTTRYHIFTLILECVCH